MNKGLDPRLERITYTLITSPERENWPVHGAFGLRGTTKVSHSSFSYEEAVEMIPTVLGLNAGKSVGDHAKRLEAKVAALVTMGLPLKRNRYDLIYKHYGMDGSDMAARLISVFSGALPPEPGSGKARFETCREQSLCKLPNCGQYPRHGRLYVQDLDMFIEGMLFTSKRATGALKKGIEFGLIEPTDRGRIMAEIAEGKFATGEPAMRAERISHCKSDEARGLLLDLVFGLRKIRKPARFERCKDTNHLHLMVANDHEILPTVKDIYVAKALLNICLANGFLAKADVVTMRKSLPIFKLPKVGNGTAPTSEQEMKELAALISKTGTSLR